MIGAIFAITAVACFYAAAALALRWVLRVDRRLDRPFVAPHPWPDPPPPSDPPSLVSPSTPMPPPPARGPYRDADVGARLNALGEELRRVQAELDALRVDRVERSDPRSARFSAAELRTAIADLATEEPFAALREADR